MGLGASELQKATFKDLKNAISDVNNCRDSSQTVFTVGDFTNEMFRFSGGAAGIENRLSQESIGDLKH